MKILLILLLSTLTISWQCGGARPSIHSTVKFHRKIISRSSFSSPIRIRYEYINFDLGSESLNNYFKDSVIPAADSFFKHTMKVHSVLGNLTIDSIDCLGFLIPESHLQYGIPNADMVIYITSINQIDDIFIAYAGTCELDEGFRNMPIMGGVAVNVPIFKESDFGSHYSTIVHELYHVFGFDSKLYEYWKKSDGSSYAQGEITEVINIRGASKTILKTINVVEKARLNFNCTNIAGVELEDHGGTGTAGSHWDMRAMYNDFMIGKDIEDPIYSDISLALLKDTGWYDVDYSYTTEISFGNKAGCDFLTNPCLENSKSNFPSLFCDEARPQTIKCDPFHIRKSGCFIRIHSKIPKEFQYFPNPQLGGDPFADYCPTLKPYINGNCRSSDPTQTFTIAAAVEHISPTSRCFESSLTKGRKLDNYAACYQVLQCTEQGAVVKVGQERVLCPFTGGQFQVNNFEGLLTCPSSKILCENFPCIDGCSGKGKCIKGICDCDPGFTSHNCSVQQV